MLTNIWQRLRASSADWRPKSLWIYLHGLGRVGWALMFGWLITVSGLVANGLGYSVIPTWIWVVLGYVTLILAPFFAFTKVHKDYLALKATYNDPTLTLENVATEYIETKALWAAKIALRHSGNRSVRDTQVRILAMTPIDQNVLDECQGSLPLCLGPRGVPRGPFEFHSQSTAEWIDVAFCFLRMPSIFVGDVPDAPLTVSPGAYVVIIQAIGHNAHESIGAYRLDCVKEDGDEGGLAGPKQYLTFETLNKPIRDVLGDDHPLAKEFDQKIAPPHPVAS